MPRIPSSLDFITPDKKNPTLNAFMAMMGKLWQRLATAFNGSISFGDGTSSDNISGNWLTVVTPLAPNTDFILTHDLGRIPAGYLVMDKSAACDVYTGSVPPTTTQITLRATGSAVTLNIFVL